MSDDRREQQTQRAGTPRTETSSEVASVFDELKRSREHVEVSAGQRALEFAARNAAAVGSSLVALLMVLGIGWLLLRTMAPAPTDDLPEPAGVEAPATPEETVTPPRAGAPALTPEGGEDGAASLPAAPATRPVAEPTTEEPTAPLPTREQLEKRERRDTAIASAVGALAALIGVLLLARTLVAWLLQRGIRRSAILAAQVVGAVACLGGMLVLALPTLSDGEEAAPARDDAPSSDGTLDDGAPSGAPEESTASTGQNDGAEERDAPPPTGETELPGDGRTERQDVRELLAPPAPRPGHTQDTPFRDMVARLRATAPARPVAPVVGTQQPDGIGAPGPAEDAHAGDEHPPGPPRIAVPTAPPTPFRDMVAGLAVRKQADAERQRVETPQNTPPDPGTTRDDTGPGGDVAESTTSAAAQAPATHAVPALPETRPPDELEPGRLLAIAGLFGAALALIASAVPLALSRETPS